MNNLQLRINIGSKTTPNWQTAYLEDDASIDIEVNSPLWNDSDTYSYEFDLPFEPNRHILGTADKMFGKSIYKALYQKECQLLLCGVPFLRGTIDLDDEVELDGGNVSISIVSGNKVFDDLLDGVSAQDVEIFWGDLREGYRKDSSKIITDETDEDYDPDAATNSSNIKDIEQNYPGKDVNEKNTGLQIRNVQIGWSYNNKEVPCLVGAGYRYSQRGSGTTFDHNITNLPVKMDIPQFMQPWNGIGNKTDFVNYGEVYEPGTGRFNHPYCNIPLCVQKYVEGADNSWEKKRGYETAIFAQDRLNTSPCFYVLFWVEQLLDIYMNVQYDLTPLFAVKDLLSLCFVNTKCKFDVNDTETLTEDDGTLRVFDFDWSDSTLGDDAYSLGRYFEGIGGNCMSAATAINAATVVASDGTTVLNDPVYHDTAGNGLHFHKEYDALSEGTNHKDYTEYTGKPVLRIFCAGTNYKEGYGLRIAEGKVELRKAYATAENFPDTDAMDILEALENAFGFKFMYDERSNKVSISFYKDVLGATDYTEINAVINEVYKKENHTSGFRLKYSASSEAETNSLTGSEELVSGGDDTTYNYNDYRKVKPIQGSISASSGTGVDYVRFISDGHISSYNETYYVSGKTGNGYRIKVDSDAKSEDEWYPSLFEVGGFRDVEYGDCEDDDYVEEKEIGFYPIIANDVNYENEKNIGTSGSDDDVNGDYRVFATGEFHKSMQQGQVSFSQYFTPKFFTEACKFVFDRTGIRDDGYQITAIENGYAASGRLQYNYGFNLPVGCDDGDGNANGFNSIDMGFTLGFVRTPNSDNSIQYFDKNYDGLGNYKFCKPVATSGTVTSDSCDVFGNSYVRYTYESLVNAGTYTKEEAKALIEKYWPTSNANLFADARQNVTASQFKAKYSFYDNDDNPAFCVWPTLFFGRYILYTPIMDNGTILSATEVDDYFNSIAAGEEDVDGIKDTDSGRKNLIIGVYSTYEIYSNYSEVLYQLFRIYSGISSSLTTSLKSTTKTVSEDVLSLKLKAEKPIRNASNNLPDERPFREVTQAEWNETDADERITHDKKYYVVDYEHGNPLYYTISEDACKNRGLFDKFWTEYAYFVTHRKIAVITIPEGGIELQTLINMDMTKRYKIGDYIGWINKYSYSVNSDGLGETQIELYYL